LDLKENIYKKAVIGILLGILLFTVSCTNSPSAGDILMGVDEDIWMVRRSLEEMQSHIEYVLSDSVMYENKNDYKRVLVNLEDDIGGLNDTLYEISVDIQSALKEVR
jgi:hypothetical protein